MHNPISTMNKKSVDCENIADPELHATSNVQLAGSLSSLISASSAAKLRAWTRKHASILWQKAEHTYLSHAQRVCHRREEGATWKFSASSSNHPETQHQLPSSHKILHQLSSNGMRF